MRIALFLPHVGIFGGVRRFLELGNSWVRRGASVTLFHPSGDAPGWLAFSGQVARLETAGSESSDLALCADPHTLDAFLAHSSRTHVYYCVIEGDPGVARCAREHSVRLAANSGDLRRRLARSTGREVLDGAGGINLSQFHPDPSRRSDFPLRVLVNGRRSRPKKGTDLILRALSGLNGKTPAFEIVLFDSLGEHNRQDPRDGAALPANARFVLGPSQDELVSLYQSSHLFVAAERKAGWCNTALEALACGAALVCTSSGTRDFAHNEENALVTLRHPWFLGRAIARLLRDAELSGRLSASGPASAEPLNWDRLAARLLDQVMEKS
jgi:glycosyltransferase involved in cell wall biosynthesis